VIEPGEGWVVMTNWVAVPTVTEMLFDVADVNEPSVKVKVYEPTRALRASPENVATPATAATVGLDTLTPPAVIVAVTFDVSPVTTELPESSIRTTGCCASAEPLVPVVDGWIVMFKWVAGGAADAVVVIPTMKPDPNNALVTTILEKTRRPPPNMFVTFTVHLAVRPLPPVPTVTQCESFVAVRSRRRTCLTNRTEPHTSRESALSILTSREWTSEDSKVYSNVFLAIRPLSIER
jgi:hypothetical protein